MATSDVTHTPAVSRPSATGLTTFAQEGMVAGLLGAVTIAVWFLVVDSLSGRPLYTPTVLGLALFQGTAGLASSVAIDLEMVLMFTWVHGLAFMAIGGLVSYLLDVAEHPSACRLWGGVAVCCPGVGLCGGQLGVCRARAARPGVAGGSGRQSDRGCGHGRLFLASPSPADHRTLTHFTIGCGRSD